MTGQEQVARGQGDHGSWSGRRVLVLGAGVSGLAAIRALRRFGAHVLVADDRAGVLPEDTSFEDSTDAPPAAEIGMPARLPQVSLVVASPGVAPAHHLLVAAREAGVEVISEPELAWRLRRPDAPPWLVVTGTNGKTTTVGMLASILLADGRASIATGNIGLPLVDVVTGRNHYDVLAVELSSFQLQRSPSIRPHSAAILNLAPDHLDWHGSMEAYGLAKQVAFDQARIAIFNLDDPESSRLAARHERPVGFTLGRPAVGALGIAEGVLLDRAFGKDVELAHVEDVSSPGQHNLANALAAAALARSVSVQPAAVAEGLRGHRPSPHRNTLLRNISGVAYVDDSKATNPHAARASLSAYSDVVWIAGGLLKGADVDDLVIAVRDRLRAVVLLGADRDVIAQALARHAPDVPVVEVTSNDDKAMSEVVRAAAALARPGSTVLLAPAAASMDMFVNYVARAQAFSEAVSQLGEGGAS